MPLVSSPSIASSQRIRFPIGLTIGTGFTVRVIWDPTYKQVLFSVFSTRMKICCVFGELIFRYALVSRIGFWMLLASARVSK